MGIILSPLCALVGQAVLHARHLPGYDAYLPLSMAVGAAGGGPVFAMGFTFHRNVTSQERIFLRKNKILLALDQIASFAILIQVIGGALVAGACALGVRMLRHVLPQSMDALHAACAGMVGYFILMSLLIVIITVVFAWHDLHDIVLLWAKRWKDARHTSATVTPIIPLQHATCQSGEPSTVSP
ncbi:hypothetical protein PAXINDRAFT_157076 [Paxillus involutus ATCC 200175]|nr:hypothetical protein PAXINDRAFT_157076 [Paxillus involutus ATCC 200175]